MSFNNASNTISQPLLKHGPLYSKYSLHLGASLGAGLVVLTVPLGFQAVDPPWKIQRVPPLLETGAGGWTKEW